MEQASRRGLLSEAVFCACQYGAPYRKATRLVGWFFDVAPLARPCAGPLCSRTGLPREPLVGVGPG
eukprot:6556767-Alexandrium_andersonii.AAC.1